MTAAPVDRAAIIAQYQGIPATKWGTDLPGIHTHVTNGPPGRHLALTFDACGGPGGSAVDTDLLNLLRAERIPATLFLNSRWIDANTDLTLQLAADPLFRIGNHGTRHGPLTVQQRSAYGIPGTRSVAEVIDEVRTNHNHIRDLTGVDPRWFRTGTAHYDGIAVAIVSELGEQVAGFAVNGDAGATFHARQVQTQLTQAKSSAIVLMHMNQPTGETREGLAAALPALRAAGTQFVHIDGTV